jgi:hypothetical protein
MSDNGPWSNQIVAVVVISASGNFTGIFIYSPAPGPGNLVGSWAASAGTDPFGNTYPKGLSVGPNSLPQVQLLLDPVLGSLVGFPLNNANYANTPGSMPRIEAFQSGSPAFAGLSVIGPQTTLATHQDFVEITFNSANVAGSSFANCEIFYVDTTGLATAFFGVDNFGVNSFVGHTFWRTATPAAPANGFKLWADPNTGMMTVQNQSTLGGRLAANQSDLTTNTNNNNVTQPITKSWPIPANDAVAGSVYYIEVPVSGTLQAQQLNIGLLQDGIFVNVVPVAAAAFAAGTGIVGTLKATIKILSAGAGGTAQWDFDGTITNGGANRSTATGIGMQGRRITNAFDTTVSHTLAIGAQWAVAAAGETISGFGSNFIRQGP